VDGQQNQPDEHVEVHTRLLGTVTTKDLADTVEDILQWLYSEDISGIPWPLGE